MPKCRREVGPSASARGTSPINSHPRSRTLDLVVTNALPVISAADAAPAWTGATYHDLGNFKDAPVVTVACGGFAGDPVAAVIDLGGFS